MRIIARRTLRDFWEQHPDSEQPLKAWFAEAQAAEWNVPQGIKDQYRSASFVGDNRVLFNIGGDKYWLIVHVNYDLASFTSSSSVPIAITIELTRRQSDEYSTYQD